MKKFRIITICIACMIMGLMSGCGNNKQNTSNKETTLSDGNNKETTDSKSDNQKDNKDNSNNSDANTDSDYKVTNHVEIDVKDYGTIKVELYGEVAPITVANFVKLCNEGFYDGLTFHRIISGFMIQGGDPLGTGMGGSDEKIKGEFSSNGIENPISHKRGVISMARSSANDSASSQFFIMHEDADYLDGNYAAFGMVTVGMDIVDKICEDTKVEDSNGTVKKENQPVINSIKVVD